MGNLSEKELAVLNETLADEELLVKKFKMLAECSQDEEVKKRYNRISEQHQSHFNALYSHLK